MKIGGFGVLAACVLLAGCGGGGGVNSTPTPPPPPPPPAPPLPLKMSATFDTATSVLSFNGLTRSYPDGNQQGGEATLNGLSVTGRSSLLTFSYDAASGSYTVQNKDGSASFGAGDRKADYAYTNIYSKTAVTTTDELTLYGNARTDTVASTPVTLSYTSYGLWARTDSAANLTTRSYFLYGQSTGAANMPTTGTATYQMVASAQIFETNYVPSTLRAIGGSATLSANFGSGTVSTVLTLPGSGFTGIFNGSGSIGADQFNGTLTAMNPGAVTTNGTFTGGFYGPGAKEAGYVFQIAVHNPDPYAGAAIAPMDTYISGVAIGASGGTAQSAMAERKPMPVAPPIQPVQAHGRKF